MIDAAITALSQLFTRPLRAVLMKAVGLALLLIVIIGIVLNRIFSALAASGATWAEQTSGMAPHAAWATLAWVLSIMAGLGIVTGALFLMPAVTAFVGSFFVDEVADAVERDTYPAEPPGHALPFWRALIEGVQFALLALVVYLCALPFVFFAGLGVVILFLANSYLLGREYFELAAMRFRTPHDAKAMRKTNAAYIFLAGMVIAVFVSIPLVNLATPIFAMAYMVHIHKRMSGKRVELIEKTRLGRHRLLRPLAQVGDDAFLAQRLARDARVASVQDQPVVRVQFVVRRDHRFQFLLDLERIFSRRQPGAVADAEDVGVDRDGRLAERDVEHHIGGLAPDARQRLQRLARARHLPAMLGHQPARQLDHVLGLGAEQPDGLDQLAHALLAERDHLFRRVGGREQRGRRLVDAGIGRLRRQHHRHQQRERIDVLELALGFRVRRLEAAERFLDLRIGPRP